jgi:hypothetical protein
MVLCHETTSTSMYQTRTSPPANYNFGHFPGYVGQSGHYAGQTHGFEQFNIDPSAFQQAQCYPMYGPGVSRQEEWAGTGNMNYSAMNNSTGGSVSPHSMNAMYQYRNEYTQNHCSNGNMNNLSPQPTGSPTASTGSSGSNCSPSNKQIRPPYDWMKKTSYVPAGPQPGELYCQIIIDPNRFTDYYVSHTILNNQNFIWVRIFFMAWHIPPPPPKKKYYIF